MIWVSHQRNNTWRRVGDGRDLVVEALLARTDLIYGSEVGAWRTNGGVAITNSSVIQKITDAKIPLIRWAPRDTFNDLTNPSVGTQGTQSRPEFDTAINGFINALGTVPMIKLPPITSESLGSPLGPAPFSRSVAITLTSGSSTITSAGLFRQRDASGYITGAGIPAGTGIAYVNANTATLYVQLTSAQTPVTATASGAILATVGHDETTAARATFVPPWNDDSKLAQNLGTYKAYVAQAGPRVRIYESNNEMEFTGWRAWRAQGASSVGSGGSVGVSSILGRHYAANMPQLKKYARSLGWEIICMGYAGVPGGTGWGNTLASPNTRTMTEFNTAVHDAYVASGYDPDYIPDAVSVHSYGHSGDFTTNGTPTDDIITYFNNWAVTQRGILKSIWGNTIGSQIKLSISEWNAGFTNHNGAGWTGFTTLGGDDVVYYYDQWLKMLRRNNFWHASCFALASNGAENYDMVTETGTTRPQYAPFKALSAINA